jgi:hypothetical protein
VIYHCCQYYRRVNLKDYYKNSKKNFHEYTFFSQRKNGHIRKRCFRGGRGGINIKADLRICSWPKKTEIIHVFSFSPKKY